MDDLIAAISSPPGEGAVALVRLSGADAIGTAQRLLKSNPALAHGHQRPARLVGPDGGVVDDVMVSAFHGPRSYTGEDVVEITCHGGILITRQVLTTLLAAGARLAGPGEFTERAFRNGKLDLTQAEAVMDLIQAQSTQALKSATEQLSGELGRRILLQRDALLTALAHLEAHIDFPEEDIAPDAIEAINATLQSIRTQVEALLETADRGRILREGVRTVIYGAPNVGKSSLLNVLLGFDRAIVSELPGTTRDTIEEQIHLGEVVLRIVDTAGIRESEDTIENAGIARTRQSLETADLLLHVLDATEAPADLPEIAAHEIRILNKCDLNEHPDWSEHAVLRISCAQSQGLDELREAIVVKTGMQKLTAGESSVAINARHQHCLRIAANALAAASAALQSSEPPELISVDIREALDALGDIVGRTDTEDLLGEIFANFCIGK